MGLRRERNRRHLHPVSAGFFGQVHRAVSPPQQAVLVGTVVREERHANARLDGDADALQVKGLAKGGQYLVGNHRGLFARVAAFQDGYSIEPVRNTRLVKIHYNSTDPAFAILAANALAALAMTKGASILRVHDVAETMDLLRMLDAVATAE